MTHLSNCSITSDEDEDDVGDEDQVDDLDDEG